MKNEMRINEEIAKPIISCNGFRKALLAFVFMFLMTGTALVANAAETITNNTTTEARASVIKNRVMEIKAMEFSNMSRTDRKEIRHELKDMNKELRDMAPNYIYISGGGLLLIILILLLIL